MASFRWGCCVAAFLNAASFPSTASPSFCAAFVSSLAASGICPAVSCRTSFAPPSLISRIGGFALVSASASPSGIVCPDSCMIGDTLSSPGRGMKYCTRDFRKSKELVSLAPCCGCVCAKTVNACCKAAGKSSSALASSSWKDSLFKSAGSKEFPPSCAVRSDFRFRSNVCMLSLKSLTCTPFSASAPSCVSMRESVPNCSKEKRWLSVVLPNPSSKVALNEKALSMTLRITFCR